MSNRSWQVPLRASHPTKASCALNALGEGLELTTAIASRCQDPLKEPVACARGLKKLEHANQRHLEDRSARALVDSVLDQIRLETVIEDDPLTLAHAADRPACEVRASDPLDWNLECQGRVAPMPRRNR